MKKRILSAVMAAAVAGTMMFTGCGSSSSSSSAGSSSASASSEAVAESSAASASSEAAEESSAASASSEAAEESSAASETSAASAVSGKKVGFTLTTLGNDFVLGISEGVTSVIESLGGTCQVDSCDGDTTKQIEQIENYVTMGMDVIMVFAVNGESVTQACQAAMDEGVTVIAFANDIPDGYDTYCGSAQEYDMGVTCAEMASDWIDENYADAGDGEVNVYVLGYTGIPEQAERTEGLKTIADNSKVNMIFEETPDADDMDEGRSRTENAFMLHPEINVVIACNGTTALGVESYLVSSDSPIEDMSKYAVFTVDETDEIDAKILSSADNESPLRGTVSLGTVDDILANFENCITPIFNGEEYEKSYTTDAFKVTPESLSAS